MGNESKGVAEELTVHFVVIAVIIDGLEPEEITVVVVVIVLERVLKV